MLRRAYIDSIKANLGVYLKDIKEQDEKKDARAVKPRANAKADYAAAPKGSGGGEALDGQLLRDDDGAGADKAQAGNNLAADTGDIRGELVS